MKRLVALTVPVIALLAISWTAASTVTGTPAARTGGARLLWTHAISPNADSAPAFIRGVRISGTSHDIVYVLAANNGSNCSPDDPVRRATIYALDAVTGRSLWTQSTSGPSRCSTAGPVADPSSRWVYAVGLDGKVHRYDAATGREFTGQGWPHTVTLIPDVEKVSATPTIANDYLYVTTSGFIGDAGHYQGHLVSIRLSTGRVHVFNTLCSNVHRLLARDSGAPNYCAAERSGLFGRGQGTVDPITHDVYIVSGNGTWNGKTNWGDSVLKLDPSGARLLDAFTPTNQQSLDSSDADLGSTAPAILPPVRQNGHVYHLLIQGGKGPACDSCSGVALRLLNRDNLSGHGGPGHLGGDLYDAQAPGGCEVLTAPAVWRGPSGSIWVFYANDCGLAGYRLSGTGGGKFRLDQAWRLKSGGTTPILRHGILYVAHDGEVLGYNPLDHKLVWYATGSGNVHWEYPLVTRSRLFMIGQDGKVRAYALTSRSS